MARIRTQQQVDQQMKGVNEYNASKHETKMEVLRQMRIDNLKGMTKTEVKDKFFAGGYGKDFTHNADGGRNAFNKYWREMNFTFLDDLDEEDKEHLRRRVLSKYMNCYRIFMENNNLLQARNTLDCLVKAAGLGSSNDKAASINIIDGNEIVIKFGLSD